MKNEYYFSDNYLGIPEIIGTNEYDKCDWIGFNYAKSCKDTTGKGIHFYLADYQFDRIWNNPKAYVNLLKKFNYVMSPDFSTYIDIPLVEQFYSHYKKHWCAAFMESNGIKVIPTISWSDENSFDWCFLGEPKHSIVSVSSVGCGIQSGAKEGFIKGYKAMIDELQPEKVLFYGKIIDEIKDLCEIEHIEPFQMKLRKMGGKK